MKKIEKIYIKAKNLKGKKKINYLKKNLSNRKYKEIEKHILKYKRISNKKLKEILKISLSDKELKNKIKQDKELEKMKVRKDYFAGKYWYYQNKALMYLGYNYKDFGVRKDTFEKMKKGKKLSKKIQLKINTFIQKNLIMEEKFLLVEIAKKLKKKEKITERKLNNLRKKIEKVVEKIKEGLSDERIEKFEQYEIIY